MPDEANMAQLLSSTKGAKFAVKVFEQMFRVVGRVSRPESLSTPDWFLRSTWSLEQHETFRRWMVPRGHEKNALAKETSNHRRGILVFVNLRLAYPRKRAAEQVGAFGSQRFD